MNIMLDVIDVTSFDISYLGKCLFFMDRNVYSIKPQS